MAKSRRLIKLNNACSILWVWLANVEAGKFVLAESQQVLNLGLLEHIFF